jgi:hypothetical protein
MRFSAEPRYDYSTSAQKRALSRTVPPLSCKVLPLADIIADDQYEEPFLFSLDKLAAGGQATNA